MGKACARLYVKWEKEVKMEKQSARKVVRQTWILKPSFAT